MPGRLVSINLSDGGVPKSPQPSAVVTVDGLDGDRHRFQYHGGLDRAVVLYAREIIEALQREGHPIAIGRTGENLTVEGIEWSRVVPGARLEVGEVLLEVTKFTTPCRTIVGSFADGDSTRIGQQPLPGWSRVCARVLASGTVRVGDPVVLRSAATP